MDNRDVSQDSTPEVITRTMYNLLSTIEFHLLRLDKVTDKDRLFEANINDVKRATIKAFEKWQS